MDAITLLKQDHKTVEALFKKFEGLTERAAKGQQELAEQITRELAIHAAIEEQVFYPAVRAAVPDADFDVREALEEHHVAKVLLAEVAKMDSAHERFRPKMTVLIENVRHHVEEEEKELFPQVREAIAASYLKELGAAMEEAKKTAPTRAHPAAPDEPPMNLVSDSVAALLDRLKDGLRAGARG